MGADLWPWKYLTVAILWRELELLDITLEERDIVKLSSEESEVELEVYEVTETMRRDV